MSQESATLDRVRKIVQRIRAGEPLGDADADALACSIFEIEQERAEARDEICVARAEPTIIVNGHSLTDAQAMAVRVAVTSFDEELRPMCERLGSIADAYQARAREVLAFMIAKAAGVTYSAEQIRHTARDIRMAMLATRERCAGTAERFNVARDERRPVPQAIAADIRGLDIDSEEP